MGVDVTRYPSMIVHRTEKSTGPCTKKQWKENPLDSKTLTIVILLTVDTPKF